MNILIIEDDEFNQIVLHDMIKLQFPHVTLTVLASAIDALKLEPFDFDLVLTDIDMQTMDGFMLYDKLRNERNYKGPIIAVTALAVEGDRERILMHGFDDYISKPLSAEALEKKLIPWIESHR
jgi:CheY-like chemotaxis protein